MLLTLLFCACSVDVSISTVEIGYDSNGDGVLSPGERGAVRVFVRASGMGDPPAALRYQLSSPSEFVDIDVGGSEGSCWKSGGERKWCCARSGTGTWFSLAPTTPPGSELPFLIRVEDTYGSGSWSLPFTLQVHAAASEPVISDVQVVQDENGDGVLNPGEETQLLVWVTNAGTVRLLELEYTLSTTHDEVTVTAEETGTYGDLEPGETGTPVTGVCIGWGCPLPRIRVSEDIALPATPTFTLRLVDELGVSWVRTFKVQVLAEP